MPFCDRFPMSAVTHIEGNTALFTRLRCQQWSCSYCADKNRAIWRAFLLNKLPAIAGDWWLMTLTAHSKTRTEQSSLDNLRKNIDRIMKRLNRVFGKLEYVRVFERHTKSEALHVHFIITGLTPFVAPGCSAKLQTMFLAVTERNRQGGIWAVKTFLKRTAQECGIGYIADIRLLDGEPAKAVGYVTKYMTKDCQSINVKGLRHIQTSRGIGSPKPDAKYDWQVASYFTNKDFYDGEVMIDLQSGEALKPEYWLDNEVYPPEMT